jgi:haloalkane dehalogenase
MDRLRTPDDRFFDLPDFDFAVHYCDVVDPSDGPPLRMAYLDEGPRDASETVILMHGEPTWSFLYRHVIGVLSDAGYRVVVPDLIGFGRSDKPTPRSQYSFARLVEWTRELLFDRLDLRHVTLFAQDWGSLIGLRLIAENSDRFARVAIGNGGLPTGEEKPNEAFDSWQKYSQSAPELPIGRIVAGGCTSTLGDEVVRGYDAPFPDESFKEGARMLPTLVPTSPDDPAHDANVAAWQQLSTFERPFLTCFSDSDPITRGTDRKFQSLVPGTKGVEHVTIVGAGHFLQEDKGHQLGEVLVSFIKASAP